MADRLVIHTWHKTPLMSKWENDVPDYNFVFKAEGIVDPYGEVHIILDNEGLSTLAEVINDAVEKESQRIYEASHVGVVGAESIILQAPASVIPKSSEDYDAERQSYAVTDELGDINR
jgi:hypothetical protein